MDTDKISPAFAIDPDLKENQYIVQMDNRLGRLVTHNGDPTPVNFIDDDNIATYYLSGPSIGEGYYVGNLKDMNQDWATMTFENNVWTLTNIKGPIGTYCRFRVAVSVSLNTSDYLFNTIGKGDTVSVTPTNAGAATTTCRYIDSVIKVTGATTGTSVDIPVRYVKAV